MLDEIDIEIDGLSRWNKIGSGGFATVYSAVDQSFGRMVAVKVLQNVDEAGRRRFDRERFSMGQLASHRHVVTPYSSGFTETGSPYVVMEYVDGGSLADLLAHEQRIGWNRAVAYVMAIADALAHAHGVGILHRDVKPENILVGSDGVAKLADFGVSLVQEGTATQAVGFSLAHAPPETFRGGTDRRDERSDLYSLASTLFTLVAGRSPFASREGDDSQLAHLERIANHPVPRLDGDPRHDEFLATALAKNPADRPSSATEFMRLLGLTTGPAGDRPATLVEAPPAVAPQIDTPLADTPLADTPLIEADPGAANADTQFRPGPPTRVEEPPGGESNGPDRPLAPTPRGHETSRRRRLVTASVIGVVATGLVVGAAAALTTTPAGEDKPPLEASTSETEPGPAEASSTTDTEQPDGDEGQLAATGDTSGADATDQTESPVANSDAAPQVTAPIRYDLAADVGSDLAVVPQDHLIVVPTRLGQTYVWDTDDPTILPTVYRGHMEDGSPLDPKSIEAAVALSDGRIASAGAGASVHVWEPTVHPGRLDMAIEGHEGPVTSLAELRDGRIASGSLDGTVRIHDPRNPRTLAIVFGQHQAPVDAVAVLADGRIASASQRQVLVWNADDPNAPPIEFTRHEQPILSLAALPDGRIASGSQEGTVLVWHPDRVEQDPFVFDRHPPGVVHVIALSDGRIASAGDDTALLWDPNDPGSAPLVYDEHQDRITAIAALPDGRLATASNDQTVRIWDPDSL